MITKEMSLKDVTELPLFRELAPYFILNYDFSEYAFFDQPMGEAYKAGGFNADSMLSGLIRLEKQLETGNCIYKLYTEAEIQAEPEKAVPEIVWLPSDDPKAAERPYIMIVPGGAYLNVWNLTEGWPIAAHFNALGYNAFVLTYRVNLPGLFPKPFADYARALEVIRAHADQFNVRWDNYITTGFSAGGHLVSMWCTEDHGYPAYGMPKPKAVFPIYPVISWQLVLEKFPGDDMIDTVVGKDGRATAEKDWSITEHASSFPPTYIALAADDDLVDPEHSKMLKRALDAQGIPVVMEMGAHGGHGFSDGRDADTWGWIERAAAFYEKHS